MIRAARENPGLRLDNCRKDKKGRRVGGKSLRPGSSIRRRGGHLLAVRAIMKGVLRWHDVRMRTRPGRTRGHLIDCLVALDQDAVMRLQRLLLDEEYAP
jgi:hypothetical protein